ncbi:cytochrome P450 [Sorangium sp. So ce394]|uniref:cytochrome P450 n=1 Tax=Sorangium sp. So ce394 TaxID=3133310 RepID=UPI003F5B5CF3
MSIETTRAFNHLVSPHLEDPYPLFEELRREAPVVFNPTFGMWFVSRHEDVAAVVKDPVRFSSAQVLAPLQEPSPALLAILGKDRSGVYPLLSSDPPVHTRVRSLVSKALAGPRLAARMEPFIRAITSELVGGLEKDGQADLMARFAAPLPIRVTSQLFGIPLSEMDQVKRWCDDETMFLMGFLPEEQRAELARSIVAYRDFLRALVEDHRASPRPDLVTELIEARAEGEGPLDTQELVGTLCVLIFAAHLTTTNMIGNTLVSLLRAPGAWQALRDRPALIPGVLEEGMRFDAPVQGMTRTVTEDCQLRGVNVPRGARVFVLFGSANRDLPGVKDPERFEIERAAGPSLAFGRGPHFCVGAQLARLEGAIALEELTRRLRGARLAGDARLSYMPNLVHRGPAALNVAWDAPPGSPSPG